MAGEFKSVAALGNYVALKLVSVQREMYRKQGAIYVPNEGEKETFKAVVDTIGNKVEDPDFEIGDEVVFNEYDRKLVENDAGDKYVIVQAQNVMAVLK